jgi:hypothetical protein
VILALVPNHKLMLALLTVNAFALSVPVYQVVGIRVHKDRECLADIASKHCRTATNVADMRVSLGNRGITVRIKDGDFEIGNMPLVLLLLRQRKLGGGELRSAFIGITKSQFHLGTRNRQLIKPNGSEVVLVLLQECIRLSTNGKSDWGG